MQLNEDTAAICGLFCGTCPCFPTTCQGCLSHHVRGDCEQCSNGFRACAKEHYVKRCFECSQMPCERLYNFQKQHYVNGIGHHVHILKDLEAMKIFGVQSWVDQQTKENTCPTCGALIYWYDKHTHTCK